MHTKTIQFLTCLLWICRLSICELLFSASVSAQETQENKNSKQSVYSKFAESEMQDFVRLNPPKPGDWLHEFPEMGQTLEQYQSKDSRALLNMRQHTIVLQPLGEFSDEQQVLLGTLKDYSQAYFQIPTRIAKPIDLPDYTKSRLARMLPAEEVHGKYDHQYEATSIVNKLLRPRIPRDAAVYLGITMEDLYAGDLNYVFGFGSFENRTGIYSLARYCSEFWNEAPTEQSRRLTLRRSMKVLSHETGHVFGLKHCVFFDCVMNGSNSLEETDRTSIHECPVCHQKIHWNLKFDPEKRFQKLREFYAKHSMQEEAVWIAKRSEHWKQNYGVLKAKP